jgi:His-Xaa-Ser system protein HxsD
MIVTLHSEVYPIESILQTCYQFIDRAYFHIDLDESGKKILVNVSFKAERPKKERAKEFRGKFLEELLHASLRHTINQRNQKLREYIVGSALFSHNPSEAAVTPPEDVPLGIAVSWE